MNLSFRVISIGTLTRNREWGEQAPKRASHATTTLIRDSETTLLVDPSLPAEILAARLDERSGLTPGDVDAVFLTTFRPIHRRSLALFDHATWFMSPREIEAIGLHLDQVDEHGSSGGEDEEVAQLVAQEREWLARMQPAPDKLTRQIHLFPTPGASPGSAGLLLATPGRTIIVAGDAIPTQDHFEAGRVLEQCADIELAMESFRDVAEIADDIIPGHDNIFRVMTH